MYYYKSIMGIIYLIQPAELIGTNRYKIGCSTHSTFERVNKGYRTGSRPLCIFACDTPFIIENKIKDDFSVEFIYSSVNGVIMEINFINKK